MAIEPLCDNLDAVAATDQPYDGEQLTIYNYDLTDPNSTVLSPANQASTYLLGGVTSRGLCSVNSSLGQNQFPIAAGGSPEHHQSRSNDALHSISHMLMEDVDERVDICQGEAALQATEQPFRDILGQPLTTPLSPYICNRSLFLPNQPLTSVGRASGSSFPTLDCQRRGVEEATTFAPSIHKLVIYLEKGILSISQLTTKAKTGERSENAIFALADQREWDILQGRDHKHHAITTCAIIRNENFDRVLLYGRKSFDQITKLRERMAATGNNNTLKGRSKGRQKLWARKQQRKELVDLRALLFHFAQAVAEDNHLFANELLKMIREHSSADGDCTERLAFYLADGLEACLAGIGGQVYKNLMERRTSH
uniref:Uncharacterized protein n=1 Tax=Aegilops tauschii TaxID=37682 RepID=R7WG26_AEGTA